VDPYDGAVNRKPEFKNGAPAGGEIRPEIIKEFGGAAGMNAKERALEYGMLHLCYERSMVFGAG